MKRGWMLALGAVAFSAVGADWTFDRTICAEDFEVVRTRTGNPEIIVQNVAPGLLVQSKMGVYKASPRQMLEQTDPVCTVPPGGKVVFAKNIRVYGFGRDRRQSSWLKTTFGVGDPNRCEFTIAHDARSTNLVCRLAGGKLDVPYASLPADFLVTADDGGRVTLQVNGLSDSSARTLQAEASFFKARLRPFDCSVELIAPAGTIDAEVTVDNLMTAIASPAAKTAMPSRIEPMPEFDPDKAGWKKVFEDEFEGECVDTNKWELRNPGQDRLVRVKDGILRLGVDFPVGCTNRVSKVLQASSLWSNEQWRYGYFEARVKFTRQNGWWAAFWLYGEENANPFTEGFEIDIFEDYYIRNRNPDGTNKKTLDHNLHLYCGSMAALKSWNYNSTLPGQLDDWYRIGCKWTPFEISYYMDGKLIRSSARHSPWSSVTFDAFNHGCGTVPLKAIVSCQIMRSAWNKHSQDLSKCVFPDWYYVDRVSVWAYPETEAASPQVAWTGELRPADGLLADAGTNLVFKVEAKPSASGQPLKAVYLFDTGYPLQCKTEPPYVFEVPFTESYYKTTRYMAPGRQNVVPSFDVPHAFVAFAQDADGKVGCTKPIEISLRREYIPSKPYQGRAHPVPGSILPGAYDEGGSGVAYSDGSAGNRGYGATPFRAEEDVDCDLYTVSHVVPREWINYTVDIAAAGDYDFVFRYGTPYKRPQRLDLTLDGKPLATVPLQAHAGNHFGVDTEARTRISLPAGRHVLRLFMHGTFNFGKFSIVKP